MSLKPARAFARMMAEPSPDDCPVPEEPRRTPSGSTYVAVAERDAIAAALAAGRAVLVDHLVPALGSYALDDVRAALERGTAAQRAEVRALYEALQVRERREVDALLSELAVERTRVDGPGLEQLVHRASIAAHHEDVMRWITDVQASLNDPSRRA